MQMVQVGFIFLLFIFVGFIGLLNWVGHVLLSERSHLSSVWIGIL